MTRAAVTQPPESPEVGRTGAVATPARGTDPNAAKYAELFDRTARPSEPDWLDALRRAAIARFVQLGFPTRKNEDWHFTSVTPIAEHAYRPVERAGRLSGDDLAPFRFEGPWDTLVFVDGHHAPELSRNYEHLEGVYVGTLRDTLADAARAERLERYVAGLANMQDHAFTALNTAFAQDGAVVMLAPEAIARRPIHVIFAASGAAPDALVSPRNLIVLERHTRATVVVSYVGVGDAEYFTNDVTEVYVGEGAQLTHCKIQRESEHAHHVGSSYAHQAATSHYETFSFATGAALSRTNIATLLDGEGAHTTMNGLYLVDHEQVVDHQTRIEHVKESCTSHELYKGVLDGDSHAVFNGQVYVRPEAQKTDGKQSNNNLLLSDGAHVDTKPQLEIYADDVKCTHGATIGRIDPTALFYFKSRGIGEATARKLLTYAFAAEVLEELTIAPVRTQLESLAFARFSVAEPMVGSAA